MGGMADQVEDGDLLQRPFEAVVVLVLFSRYQGLITACSLKFGSLHMMDTNESSPPWGEIRGNT